MTYSLSIPTQKSAEKLTGLAFAVLTDSEAISIDRVIENRIGKKLAYPQVLDSRLPTRGSVLLALGRFLHSDGIDKKIDRSNKKWKQL
jgi:hypothetical protein